MSIPLPSPSVLENDPHYRVTGELANVAGGKNADWLREQDGVPADHDGWYRGHHTHLHPCSPVPNERAAQNDFIDTYIMQGLRPEKPFISRNDFVTAFGSCFAQHVETFLHRYGYTVATRDFDKNTWSQSLIVQSGDGFVNTAAIRQQLDWALHDEEPDFAVWRKIDGQIKEYLETNKPGVRELLSATTVFIFTIGLSEVWYDKITGKVLFSPVPSRLYDPALHGVRTLSVDENVENLQAIVSGIRSVYPRKPIIFTLSPIPLLATYKENGCIVSNTVSKSILRVALDTLMNGLTPSDSVHYFPSYEMVTGLFPDPWGTDRRHVNGQIIENIMHTFMRYYASDWP